MQKIVFLFHSYTEKNLAPPSFLPLHGRCGVLYHAFYTMSFLGDSALSTAVDMSQHILYPRKGTGELPDWHTNV